MIKVRLEGPRRGWQFGIGTLELLGLLFVGLKLGGVVDWPWLAVTAPFWALPALGLAGVLIAILGLFLTKLGHSMRSPQPPLVGDAEGKALDKAAGGQG